MKIVTDAGGGIRVYDTRTPGGPNDGILLTPEEARALEASRKRDVTEAGGDPARARELPGSVLAMQQNVDRARGFIDDLRAGRLKTGQIYQGKLSGFTPKGEDFNAFASQRVIDLISSATFGQLSEGEREFLSRVEFSLLKDEEINIQDLERYAQILDKAIEIETKDINRLEGVPSGDGWSIER